MKEIRKLALIKNLELGKREYEGVLEYLNIMSGKGLHISDFGRLTNAFEKDESKRYVYSVCQENDEGYFADSADWDKAATKNGMSFFRKEIPYGAVSIRAEFVGLSEETEWLNDRLDEGLMLCGVSGSDYLFTKTPNGMDGEFIIERPGKREDIGSAIALICTEKIRYICCSGRGLYYFFTPDTDLSSKKHRLRKAIKKTYAVSLMTLTFMVLSTFVGSALIVLDLTGEQWNSLIFTVCLSVLGIGALILTVMRIRVSVLKSKYDRSLLAEKRRLGDSVTPETSVKSQTTGDGYGDPLMSCPDTHGLFEVGATEIPVTANDEADTPSAVPAEPAEGHCSHRGETVLIPSENMSGTHPKTKKRRATAVFMMAVSVVMLLTGLVYCYLWASHRLTGILDTPANGSAGLVIALFLIVTFPFLFFSSLGK